MEFTLVSHKTSHQIAAILRANHNRLREQVTGLQGTGVAKVHAAIVLHVVASPWNGPPTKRTNSISAHSSARPSCSNACQVRWRPRRHGAVQCEAAASDGYRDHGCSP
ncbi:hypothetical protein [Xanthomonas sacchari]|uniref:hypothetical protein n=1 Tax=Xanthomonas sacchari TaxID=56458 RepID=UPI00225771CF|nr:hypothetical protein [Xanthomonas sacchari]